MGSKLGWYIAGGFVLILLVLIITLVLFPPVSKPRDTLRPGMMEFHKPALPISSVLGSEPTGEGNAGDDYAKAYDSYQSSLPEIKQAAARWFKTQEANEKAPMAAEDEAVFQKVADVILAGTAKKSMKYEFVHTPATFEGKYYAFANSKLQDLYGVLKYLVKSNMNKGEAGYPAAEKYLFSALIMGQHMIDERARLQTVTAGASIQRQAANTLVQLYGLWNKPDRAEAARKYAAGVDKLSDIYGELYKICWHFYALEGGGFSVYAGDLFNLAENHPDRCVRIEAMLSAGTLKFTADTRGDKKHIREVIADKLKAEDPAERAAGQAADALTVEGFNALFKLEEPTPAGQ